VKPKVYLETTIPSLLTAWPSRDVVIAGQQQTTRDWWNGRRKDFGLFISGLVLMEARRGNISAAKAREEVLSACEVLDNPESAQSLASEILASRLLPAKAAADAVHIAIATVHRMDFLLTWNCRHIANAAIVEDVRAVCVRSGYFPPIICTPLELMV
jgi:predicted nucleic acid-binding protein